MLRSRRIDSFTFAAAALFIVSAIAATLVGDPGAFRYAHLVLAVGVVFVGRAEEGAAHRLAFPALAATALVWCVWISLSRHLAFGINGVDFSIFDWQVASTARGAFGYSPIYDVNHFGVHSTFLLLLLVPLHAIVASPNWLLIAGALAIWSGIFPLRRLSRAFGVGRGFELLLLLAWLDNAWLGRLLNAGFRIESLTPTLLLWVIVGWVEKKPVITIAATIAALLVKEDAALVIPAFVIGAALRDRAQGKLAATITAICLGWLWTYVAKVQPALASAGPAYLSFWADFGNTPKQIVVGIITHPLRFASLMATSGWWMVALPTLFLPFLSLRALAGMLPTLVMLGASSNPSMHDYSTYYPVALVPFVMLGLIEARARGGRWATAALLATAAFPLFWYGYARSVTPKFELERDVRAEIERSASAPRVVVQTILFPHVGYGKNLRPLMSEEELKCAPGDVVLLAPALDSWPFEFDAPGKFVTRLEGCGERVSLPSGLEVVRITRDCTSP